MKWLIAAAYNALRLYVGGGVFDRIKAEVEALLGADALSGAEKMARVLAFAQAEFRHLSTTAIRAVVEVVLLRVAGGAA